MAADFWAGYISGAVGILIGNPLDVLKVRLQASSPSPSPSTSTNPSPLSSLPSPSHTPDRPPPRTITARTTARLRSLATGTAAPVLGYGALNALLFVTYNRSGDLLTASLDLAPGNLWTPWVAGCLGGLATWVVSTPTELIKCRAQLSSSSSSASSSSTSTSSTSSCSSSPRSTSTSTSSYAIARRVLRHEGGIRGLYLGGAVTALRDGVGYGFYFWSYELMSRRWWTGGDGGGMGTAPMDDAARVLLCGGLAGVVTWASVFPLDVVKTRVQTQIPTPTLLAGTATTTTTTTPLLGLRDAGTQNNGKRLGAVQVAREAYRREGVGVFFRGLTVCSVRAFIVNAVQWAVYEWIMLELGQRRRKQTEPVSV
ncbi:mitochondrial carrier domain-containing protein [Xylariomycetidae sp. FL2044]|nr:mitochondrial carrier domain-containing protein [Xylariomycetidae sp. FL2044]